MLNHENISQKIQINLRDLGTVKRFEVEGLTEEVVLDKADFDVPLVEKTILPHRDVLR